MITHEVKSRKIDIKMFILKYITTFFQSLSNPTILQFKKIHVHKITCNKRITKNKTKTKKRLTYKEKNLTSEYHLLIHTYA